MEKKEGNFNRRNFIRVSAITGLGLSLNLYSCKKSAVTPSEKKEDEDDKGINDKIALTGILLPEFIDTEKKSKINIIGKGFQSSDTIVLISQNDSTKQYSLKISVLTEEHVTISLPENMKSGKYRLIAKRGSSNANIGITTIHFVFNSSIPEQSGMTVKGVVYANGVGLANVVVSDGFEVTKTNNKGIYYLPSAKKSSYVFISIPGNYEVENKGRAPLFYSRLERSPTITEVKDFSLKPVNNENHTVMVLGDMHLASRNNDIEQFQKGFLVDVNQTIQSYENKGTKVYGLTLGDMTWEAYWYRNNYSLGDYVSQMNRINTTVFNTMGNHDNDPYIANDWYAENKFRDIIGPTYYSFNLGKIHYIVLDNIEYINTGASSGIDGARNYNAKIVADQMEWLRRDLAMIEDKSTPVVIAMHIQLNNNPTLDANGKQKSTKRLMNADEFISAVSPFSTVHVLTGHSHYSYAVENSSSLMEHNTAAVCATWWWTGRNGYAGNHICKDGTPGGYAVWEMVDRDIKWYYKGISHQKNYQFRTYDLNKIHITKERYASQYTGVTPATDTESAANWNTYVGEYANENNNNEVLINVWRYDEKWEIEVTENGQPLDITRVRVRDPLHIISYAALRLNANARPTAAFTANYSTHMFKVKASNAESTLFIKVTDRFGNVYSEEMIRPKTFDYLMT